MRDWGRRYFLFPYCTNTNKILLSLMFLLLLHPLDSWKVAMIFVSNIIHRVTFLFSLLFSFYWACQKFSSSCWRIIALSRCQIKLAKCLNTACAHSISRSPGWLRRADLRVRVRARANPLISAGDDHPPPPALPRHPFNTCWAMVWPHTPGLIRWFMPHKTDFCQIQMKLSLMIFWVPSSIYFVFPPN